MALPVTLAFGDAASIAPRTNGEAGGETDGSDRSGARPARRVRPLRFAVIGDFGSGSVAQHAVARRMCTWRRKHPFRLLITTGDNIYPNGSSDHFQRNFFEPYACLLSGGVRWQASLGNHDVRSDDGLPELNEPAFGLQGRRNYVVRRRGVRLVIADSNAFNWRWLKRETQAEPGDRWTVVVFHHPVFSPGPHGSTPGLRPALPRLFRRRGVDLVLNGHDHFYAVTHSLRGIRYVVTGGGGAELYDCGSAWFLERCVARHHFLYIVARQHSIRVRAIGIEGDALARFRTFGRS